MWLSSSSPASASVPVPAPRAGGAAGAAGVGSSQQSLRLPHPAPHSNSSGQAPAAAASRGGRTGSADMEIDGGRNRPKRPPAGPAATTMKRARLGLESERRIPDAASTCTSSAPAPASASAELGERRPTKRTVAPSSRASHQNSPAPATTATTTPTPGGAGAAMQPLRPSRVHQMDSVSSRASSRCVHLQPTAIAGSRPQTRGEGLRCYGSADEGGDEMERSRRKDPSPGVGCGEDRGQGFGISAVGVTDSPDGGVGNLAYRMLNMKVAEDRRTGRGKRKGTGEGTASG